jgi:transcriptional regulator with XRE-family HTH domain
MISHDELKHKILSDPDVKAVYDDLEGEYMLLKECLKARSDAMMTQEDVATRMGAKAPAVSRIESGGGRNRHSPSLATLLKYADAVGCKLEIRLVPKAGRVHQ